MIVADSWFVGEPAGEVLVTVGAEGAVVSTVQLTVAGGEGLPYGSVWRT